MARGHGTVRRGIGAVRAQPDRISRDIRILVRRYMKLLLRVMLDLLNERVRVKRRLDGRAVCREKEGGAYQR